MTIENQLYGVPTWVRCVVCGVLQPKQAMDVQVSDPRLKGKWQCKNAKKCAEWAAELKR